VKNIDCTHHKDSAMACAQVGNAVLIALRSFENLRVNTRGRECQDFYHPISRRKY
jgi:hypothetical protein